MVRRVTLRNITNRTRSERQPREIVQIGGPPNGYLKTIEDLNSAADIISFTELPRIGVFAYWTLERYIQEESGRYALVAVVTSPRAFTISSTRDRGIELLETAISAVEQGHIGLSATGSDVNQEIDPYDLAVLHQDLLDGKAEGWFVLRGVFYS